MMRNGARSIVLLLALSSSAMAGDWRDYQRQYQQFSQRPRAVEVEEIENPDLNIRERCLSCHLGVEDPQMAEREQPLRTHPGRYLEQHPPRQFGCTLCHQGNGEALDQDAAHGDQSSRALLRGDLIETRCTRCHQNRNLEGAPSLSRGYALIEEMGCTGCHELAGFQTKGPPCPPLSGIGSKVDYPWLVRWLENPQAFSPTTAMPDFHLTRTQASALAAYLMTMRNARLEALPPPPEGDPDTGGNLLRTVRCISCHSFAGKGGYLAPDLGRIGNKVRPAWLYYMLKDTHRYLPGTSMPQFNMSDEQAGDVMAYLFEEFTDYDLLDESEADPIAEQRGAQTVDMGRRIYKELRCSNCHAHTGEEEWMQLGPVLTHIGDRSPGSFDFGNSQVARTTGEFIFEKIRHPLAFASQTNLSKMPDFHLADDRAKDITLVLLASRTYPPLPAAYRVPPAPTSVYEPGGRAGELVHRYRCFSCHAIKGRGYNLAYDLSVEGSRVQRDWLRDYLQLSYSIRPILTERMPVFNFPRAETEILTDYIATQLRDDALETAIRSPLTTAMAARGQALFDEKGCMACHIVNSRGGYVGPSFTIGSLVGDKLQAGWIYRWLKNPQALVPDTIEPNYNLSDAEARDITAYLMSIGKEEAP